MHTLEMRRPTRGAVLAGMLLAGVPCAAPRSVAAQGAAADSAAERIRTESGVDPTRVVSRASTSVEVQDLSSRAFRSAVNGKLQLGVGGWTVAAEVRYAAFSTGAPGAPLRTGFGDVGLTVLRALGQRGRHAFAVGGKAVVPTAEVGVGAGTVNVTPSAVWAYTLRPTLLVAVQPQYSASVQRADGASALRLLTVRAFVASFRPSGWFLVGEPRLLADFDARRTDVLVSPIVGRNVGQGINVSALAELPLAAAGRDRYGVVTKLGVQKNF